MRACFISFFLVLFYNAHSQTSNNPVLVQPVPPSPNAASLGKYGEVPVGLYTGVPDITVPIWELKDADISLPISLSYHASGVKVEETASWVGLGWSLNAGGVITRSVRGRPDEQQYLNRLLPTIPDGLLNPANLAYSTACDFLATSYYAYNVGQGLNDSEPDAFFFNFNGHSGKFVLDQNGVAYTIPYQPIKISTNAALGEWSITTQDGFIYKFGAAGFVENTDTYSVNYPYYGWPVTPSNMTTALGSYISAWYLREIDSPMGGKLVFSYTQEEYKNNSGISQSLIYNAGAATPTILQSSVSSTYSHIIGLRLSSITTSSGSSVNFNPGAQRQDLKNFGVGAYSLGNIAIKDWNGNTVKTFQLNTDYFVSTGGIEDYYNYRLRLNSIREIGNDGTTAKPPYVFSYDNQYTLPPRNSTSQDHWGYFNGAVNTDVNGYPTLIPNYSQGFVNFVAANYAYKNSGGTNQISNCPDPNNPDCQTLPSLKTFYYQGANRAPNFNFAKTGILNSIKYPTGGSTVFTYEPHDYQLPQSQIQYQTVDVTPVNILGSCPNCSVSSSFIPNNNIPSAFLSNNPKPVFDFTISFNLDGNDNICCKCGQPVITLTDVTTNTVLIQAGGYTGLTIDASIQNQLNGSGIANFIHPNSTMWTFTGVLLNPSHTYTATATTNVCPPEKCGELPTCPTNQSPKMEAAMTLHFQYNTNTVLNYNSPTGGMRIKTIANYISSTDANPQVRSFVYKLHGNPTNEIISSGVLVDTPIYFDYNTIRAQVPIGGLPEYYQVVMINSTGLTLTSGSKFELGQTSGSNVGYSEVREILCQDSNCSGQPYGNKISTFLTSNDNPDVNAGVVGYVFNMGTAYCPNVTTPNPSNSDIRYFNPNSLSLQSNYFPYPSKVNMDWKRGLPTSELIFDATKKLIRKTEYSYNSVFDPTNRKTISGLKIILSPLNDPQRQGMDLYYGRYDLVAAWNYKNQEITTEIDNNGNQLVTTKSYYYDNPTHAMLTRTESINSKGEVIKSLNRYVGDQGSIANLKPYETDAISKLNAQYRIATIIQNEEYKNGAVVGIQRNSQRDWGTGLILPDTLRFQVGSNPMEGRVQLNKYDLAHYGNLLEEQFSKNVKKVYLYGYHYTMPIAEIIGSDYATVNALLTSLNINLSILDNPSSDAQLQTELNKIRLATSAQVTTYTYKPLVGITSVTDPNNKTTYYSYDALGRLILVKDSQLRILKTYSYNYKQ